LREMQLFSQDLDMLSHCHADVLVVSGH
jgi:hypothetical protein